MHPEKNDHFTLTPLAYYKGPFKEKFGLPRQAGMAALRGEVQLTEPFHDMVACRGLENFSHIWLIWAFSEVPAGRTAHTTRPPRLKGNKRVGVFASRTPYRPNRLGLSAVRLEKIGPGPVLHVLGADLLDGTAVFDIKPYIPYADALPDAEGAYADAAPEASEVLWPEGLKERLDPEDAGLISDILAQDPRPAYQHDPSRVYGFRFKNYEIKFRTDRAVEILSIEEKA